MCEGPEACGEPANSVQVLQRLLGDVGGQGNVLRGPCGRAGGVGSKQGVCLDVIVDGASERTSETNVIASPAFK